MKHIDLQNFAEAAEAWRQPYHDHYYAMYSSVYGGIVTDPVLMMLPADDHLVHRGDGIFETLKCVDGSIYNMPAHLDRLEEAASSLHFTLPAARESIRQLVVETVRAAKRTTCLIRILVSRGPGSFDVNPYDAPQSQLYIIVSHLKPPFMEMHPEGARVRTSRVAVKAPFFARLKTCDYLPNVLMKKEAVDAGVDFVVAFDEQGFLTEGATENVGIVASDGALLFPRAEAILDGTTMIRVMALAKDLLADGALSRIAREDITKEAMVGAREVLIVGTTPNVIAVTEFDDQPVGDGQPGPVARALYDKVVADIRDNPDRQTRVE